MLFAQAPPDVLLLAAFPPELATLRSVLGDDVDGRFADRHVIARTVGVGIPQAAIGAHSSIAEWKPRAVILLGTCGAYSGEALRIGDVIVSKGIYLVDAAVADGRAAFPELMMTTHESDAALRAAIAPHVTQEAAVATVLAVTTNDELAATLRRVTGAAVEHLEAFSVAAACAALHVPFVAVLGVANSVGSKGREEWRAHHEQAARAAAHAVMAWLEANPCVDR